MNHAAGTDMAHLPFGLELVRRKKLAGLGFHYGIRVWPSRFSSFVVDFQSDSRRRTLPEAEFACGRLVETCWGTTDPRQIAQSIQRVSDGVAGPFNIVKNNCEHFARRSLFGIDKSDQIVGLTVCAAAILVIALVARIQ